MTSHKLQFNTSQNFVQLASPSNADSLSVLVFISLSISLLLFLLPFSAEGLCSILSPSVVQWDAMTVFTECVLGQTFRNLTGEVFILCTLLIPYWHISSVTAVHNGNGKTKL